MKRKTVTDTRNGLSTLALFLRTSHEGLDEIRTQCPLARHVWEELRVIKINLAHSEEIVTGILEHYHVLYGPLPEEKENGDQKTA